MSEGGTGQDHLGTPRPDALISALGEDQLAALREIGHEWDRVSAGRQVWRQALPADPPLGEYPGASEVRPGLFTRFAPVESAPRRLAAMAYGHSRLNPGRESPVYVSPRGRGRKPSA